VLGGESTSRNGKVKGAPNVLWAPRNTLKPCLFLHISFPEERKRTGSQIGSGANGVSAEAR
jgi:hypothetical protein